MKHSIRRQMIAVFVGLIVCMLVILLLLVGSGLEPYYIREKKDNFTELYNEIDQITQNGEMTEDEIRGYIATGEPSDKAGGYGIQGAFAKYIDRIDGDYYNVVGLPVSFVYQTLKEIGAL